MEGRTKGQCQVRCKDGKREERTRFPVGELLRRFAWKWSRKAALSLLPYGMAGYQQLLAWRVSNRLACEVDDATRRPGFRGAYRLADQLRRSSVSTASNVAEGHGRSRRAGFAHFLLIARGSGVEVQAQLVLALDEHRLTYSEYTRLRGLADHAVALITNLRKAVLGQED